MRWMRRRVSRTQRNAPKVNSRRGGAPGGRDGSPLRTSTEIEAALADPDDVGARCRRPCRLLRYHADRQRTHHPPAAARYRRRSTAGPATPAPAGARPVQPGGGQRQPVRGRPAWSDARQPRPASLASLASVPTAPTKVGRAAPACCLSLRPAARAIDDGEWTGWALADGRLYRRLHRRLGGSGRFFVLWASSRQLSEAVRFRGFRRRTAVADAVNMAQSPFFASASRLSQAMRRRNR